MRNRTIQARISEDTDHEIQFLKETLGIGRVTEIITLSIHRLALEHQQNKAKQSPFEALEELGLIGCIQNADPLLSQNYKSIISTNLKTKHANS
ncbi:MAG: hypothetical protein WCK42_03240 [Myxococcaceae bacterium]